MTDKHRDNIHRTTLGLRGWMSDNSLSCGGIIPEYMLGPIAGYLLFGEPSESRDFLEAIICDRAFSETVPLADDRNQGALLMWHRLLFNVFPRLSWGSEGKMLNWIKVGGTGGELIPYLERYVNEPA